MTLQELTELFRLKEELANAEQILESLKAAAQPKAAKMTGMPHMSGVNDRVGDLAAEIVDTEKTIQSLNERITKTEKRVTAFISDIPDVQTRTVFRLRFIRSLTWKEVSSIMGRKYTVDSVKNRVYKYLCEHTA